MKLLMVGGWALLLAGAGFMVLYLYLNFEYRRLGRLTAFGNALVLGVFAGWAAFPVVFLPADWPAVHSGVVRTPLAWICLAGGLSLLGLSIFELGLTRTFGGRGAGLKTDGIYALTRNPQLLGGGLYGAGFFLFWTSIYSLLWLLLYALFAWWTIAAEEEHLMHTFGAAYREYCEKVPRTVGSPSPDGARDTNPA